MIFAEICLLWIGMELEAPVWYYIMLVLWLLFKTIEVCTKKPSK